MQQSNAPSKIYVPFAQNDSSKVNVPVTTTDATRASQSLGFPPLTGEPPESGGVPPQLEDFNGAINQIASIAWWVMGGNFYPYDATFAASSYIGGYANGAKLLRLDNTGDWLNTVDNNVTNPDATDGTAANWTPGYNYGAASIAVSSTAITVRPVQAAKKILILTGTLSANTTVTLPAWVYEWTIINNTAMVTFTLLLNTASGTGVYLQAGALSVRGDGTNIVQDAKSTAPATTPTQYPQAQQVTSGALWTATAGGTANALTASLSFSPNTIASGQEFTVVAAAANTSTTVTLALTLGSAAAVTYNVTKGNNAALAQGDIPAAGYPCVFVYNPTTGAVVLTNPATGIVPTPTVFPSISVAVASNALTGTFNATAIIPFRNATLTSGAPVSATIAANLTLVVPSTATLGTIAATQARLIWLLLYNGGTPVLGVVNLAGGVNLDETTLISSTAISTGATSNNVVYSTAAITSSPFRVIGFCDITESTAGTWATAPTVVQGIGGQALAALSSLGYGVGTSPSNSYGVTYYNTTGRTKQIFVTGQSATAGDFLVQVNGRVQGRMYQIVNVSCGVGGTVPPNGSYIVNGPGVPVVTSWTEQT
jgi:hypothetical protein